MALSTILSFTDILPMRPILFRSSGMLSLIHILRVTSAFVIALAVGLLVYYFLFYTSKGFQLRAVGLNMTAAEFNGFAVKKYILMRFIVSGAIAGLGGSAELPVSYTHLAGASFASSKAAFQAPVAALDAARPSSQAVKAAASRRYFSMVAGLFSSHTRRCLNAWSCSPVMV